MVKFPLKFFYNIGVISEILELPRFCPDFLQKKFYNIKPWRISLNFKVEQHSAQMEERPLNNYGRCSQFAKFKL